jgi:tRNA(adenine34) deaminase
VAKVPSIGVTPYIITAIFMELDDAFFMRKALQQAERAFAEDEVPVGAVVVSNGQIIGTGYNQSERLHDVTAHAEMIAITAAQEYLGAKYLKNCTLYVTLEPCTMCAGALYWSQVEKIVIAARDPKRGFDRLTENILHPKTEVVWDVMADDGAALMSDFFKKLR